VTGEQAVLDVVDLPPNPAPRISATLGGEALRFSYPGGRVPVNAEMKAQNLDGEGMTAVQALLELARFIAFGIDLAVVCHSVSCRWTGGGSAKCGTKRIEFDCRKTAVGTQVFRSAFLLEAR